MKLHDGDYDLGVIAFRFGIAFERKNRLRDSVMSVSRSLVAQGTESASLHFARMQRIGSACSARIHATQLWPCCAGVWPRRHIRSAFPRRPLERFSKGKIDRCARR
jgi:DNA-binding IclR family transcriptional regulator